MLAHSADPLHRATNPLQGLLRLKHTGDAVLSFVDAQAGNTHRFIGTRTQGFDNALDLDGRVPGLAGQRPHLIGDHGKTTALLAGTGGFDGGIEGQQVGLLGDAANHIGGQGDVLGLAGQVGHGLVDLADGTGQ
ncbi:hypothetical protein D3C76_1459410 [compost metagenome]